MPHSRTHHDREQLARTTSAESVARNAHGQSLDEARESFRAEWQAKIDRKRQQAKEAAEGALFCYRTSRAILIGAASVGALCGGVMGLRSGLPSALFTAISGALVAVLLALLPAGAVFVCAWLLCENADRLKREADELERS